MEDFSFDNFTFTTMTRVFVLGRKETLRYSAAYINSLLERLHIRTGWMMRRSDCIITSPADEKQNANALKNCSSITRMYAKDVVPALERYIAVQGVKEVEDNTKKERKKEDRKAKERLEMKSTGHMKRKKQKN
jgi:hypothetical protein